MEQLNWAEEVTVVDQLIVALPKTIGERRIHAASELDSGTRHFREALTRQLQEGDCRDCR